MSLLDIAQAISTQMAEADPTGTPPFEFGAKMLSVERSAPVIIYVPLGETIGGPRGQGGDGVRDPRPLWTREVTIAAHIWADDVPAVEVLYGAFVQAMHAQLWGAYKLSSGRWATAAEIVTGWGVEFTLNMVWLVPLTRAPATFAAVSSMPITPEIVTVIS